MIFKYNESAGIHSFDPAFAKDHQEFGFAIRFITVWFSWILIYKFSLPLQSVGKFQKNGLQYDFIIRDDVAFHHSEKYFGINGQICRCK